MSEMTPRNAAIILERKAGEAAVKEAAAPNESEATYYNGMVEAFREAARIVRERDA